MAENEINQRFNVEIHVPFPKHEGDVHILSDQEKSMHSQSVFSTVLLPSEIVIEEEWVVLDPLENGEIT